MMLVPKKCALNLDWTNLNISEVASWIKPAPHDAYSAQCTVCCKKFSLSNMGKTAVSSHAASKKYQTALKLLESASQTCLLPFFRAATVVASSSSSSAMNILVGSSTNTTRSLVTPPATVPGVNSMGSFLLKKDVTKAEIIWYLNDVMTHCSLRTAAESAALFPLMFPTSEIATKI